MLNFVMKVVSRCNLNCHYCYVYNKGDATWRSRPAIMPPEVFEAALERIRRYCGQSGQKSVQLTFHGGEPCLAGVDRFGRWCRAAQEVLGPVVDVDLAVQTNGTLLDGRWADTFRVHRVRVGVSVDGPKEVHDAVRVDHRGRGSRDAVGRGVARLTEAGVTPQILCVIPFGADGLAVHRDLRSLGVTRINYLLPDFSHDTVLPIRRRYGPTPCADFLLPVLEHWWANESIDVRVAVFWHMSQLILGGRSRVDIFGNRPFRFVFIETDGAIEGLDVLRVCREGMAGTGLNVLANDFSELAGVSGLHRAAIFDGVPAPTGCRACPERQTCSGGYLPHRYSHSGGFDNPSVWCADILKLFGRLRELLGVSVEETALRGRVLEALASEGTGR